MYLNKLIKIRKWTLYLYSWKKLEKRRIKKKKKWSNFQVRRMFSWLVATPSRCCWLPPVMPSRVSELLLSPPIHTQRGPSNEGPPWPKQWLLTFPVPSVSFYLSFWRSCAEEGYFIYLDILGNFQINTSSIYWLNSGNKCSYPYKWPKSLKELSDSNLSRFQKNLSHLGDDKKIKFLMYIYCLTTISAAKPRQA